ncbi:MAG TPA: hypothetical protein VNM45_10015 [Bacillus sp. (in: firmicutes)]|nr:hypothetical protein [Bacillus sp. (in: firmicutes)]
MSRRRDESDQPSGGSLATLIVRLFERIWNDLTIIPVRVPPPFFSVPISHFLSEFPNKNRTRR